MTGPKVHPDTEGFWMDYKYKVAERLPGKFIKKGELDRVMYHYINDFTVEECAAWVLNERKRALL